MKRVIHPYLKRGHFADRAAIVLLLALLTVLVGAVVHGFGTLGA